MATGDFTFFYSGNKNNTLGTGFSISGNYKHSIIDFEMVNERICVLRVRAQFFNINLIVCMCQ
jgi:hypothetical protein